MAQGQPGIAHAGTDNGGTTTDREAQLWEMADALRGSMDVAEYKHIVLGLIFLKCVSDAFEEMRARLRDEQAQGVDPEDPDEYRAGNIFWVSVEARWARLRSQARQPDIGKIVDAAMASIERDNPDLRDALPKGYVNPALGKQRLGQLIDLIGTIRAGNEETRSKDAFGHVYEYFLSRFASAEGKKGGEFYTPKCIVKLLVEMLAPYNGRVYDPCCGSSGMLVQSIEFMRTRAIDNRAPPSSGTEISIYGQELNHATWRLALMNLAIRGIAGQIERGDSFHDDLHPDLKANFIIANPPFNVSDWGGELLTDDKRWLFGVPPESNANFAWVQHMVHHLAPAGTAGFALANGSMSSSPAAESLIRKNLIEADIVDCMVALPGQLFHSTQIPVCLWFLKRGRSNGRHGDRTGQILFIDARKLGRMVDRTHRDLTDEYIARIVATYHDWAKASSAGYADVPGFCKSADLNEVRENDHSLAPGHYVDMDPQEENGKPFEEKMKQLVGQLREQRAESKKLDAIMEGNLKALGFPL